MRAGCIGLLHSGSCPGINLSHVAYKKLLELHLGNYFYFNNYKVYTLVLIMNPTSARASLHCSFTDILHIMRINVKVTDGCVMQHLNNN